jgi:membrane-bound lytic murein transglycosylase B
MKVLSTARTKLDNHSLNLKEGNATMREIVSAGRRSRGALLRGFLIFLTVSFFPTGVYSAEDIYKGLKNKLLQDGFSAQQVSSSFRPPPPPMFKLVAQTMKIREGVANYDFFLAPSEIASARRFIADHRSSFRNAEAAYGVEPEIIAAILLVETHFGSYTGKTPTLAVLSTFAIMDLKANRDNVWKLLPPHDRQKWGREAFDMKLIDRSGWAYRELCALMELRDKHGIRPESLKGSIMGAIGWPQFLPSSLVKYGVDGNGDGRIDLYEAGDAIFSTANYLKGHGWCEAKSPAQKEAVIWEYNHSKAYVRVVLAIADRIGNEDRSGMMNDE